MAHGGTIIEVQKEHGVWGVVEAAPMPAASPLTPRCDLTARRRGTTG